MPLQQAYLCSNKPLPHVVKTANICDALLVVASDKTKTKTKKPNQQFL